MQCEHGSIPAGNADCITGCHASQTTHMENFANIVRHALVQHCLMDTMYCKALQRLIFLHLGKHGSGSYCSPSPAAGLMIPLPQCFDPKQWDHTRDMFSIDVTIRISLPATSILYGFLLLNLYSVVIDIHYFTIFYVRLFTSIYIKNKNLFEIFTYKDWTDVEHSIYY